MDLVLVWNSDRKSCLLLAQELITSYRDKFSLRTTTFSLYLLQVRGILLRHISYSLHYQNQYKYLLFEMQCNIGYAFYKIQGTYKDPPFRLIHC